MGVFKKKESIQFSGRNHTLVGVLSGIIGLLVIMGFIALAIISGLYGGKGGLVIGIMGILLFALAVIGFVLSYKGLKQRDVFLRFPMIGIISNGIMLLLLVIMYVMGIYV